MVLLFGERTRETNDQRLRTAFNIGYSLIVQDKDRNQSNAQLIASRTFVQDALSSANTVSLQNELLDPYRQTMLLDFVTVLGRDFTMIGEAKRTSPAQLSDQPSIRSVVNNQRPTSVIVEIGDRTWLLAAAPIVRENRTMGVLIVGRVLDENYVSNLSGRLGGYEVVVQHEGALTATSTTLQKQIAAARLPQPVRPTVVQQREGIQTWKFGNRSYDVVSRGIGFGSQATLALAEPHTDDALVPDTMLPRVFWYTAAALALSVLAMRLGLSMATAPLRQLALVLTQAARSVPTGETADIPVGAGELGRAASLLIAHTTQVERTLSAQQGTFDAMLNSMPVGVVVSDVHGAVQFMNVAARDLLGLHIHPNESLAVQFASNSEAVRTVQGRNGRVLAAATAHVVDGVTPTPTLVTVLQDVTREQQLEQMRTDFLSTISHELRTPLTAVKTSTELLLDGDAGEMTSIQRRFLQTIRRNSERLIGLVNELLDLSRIESGQVQLSITAVDARRVVDDVASNLANLFDSKQQHVELDLPQEPVLFRADRRRLEQMLTNLLANAGTYTPEGGNISISTGYDPNREWVEVCVRDSGPGISLDEQSRIFEKFFRGGHALTRQDGGTGLGLAIVKSLVDLHRGKVSVSSEPGQGACFTVTLPRMQGDGDAGTARR